MGLTTFHLEVRTASWAKPPLRSLDVDDRVYTIVGSQKDAIANWALDKSDLAKILVQDSDGNEYVIHTEDNCPIPITKGFEKDMVGSQYQTWAPGNRLYVAQTPHLLSPSGCRAMGRRWSMLLHSRIITSSALNSQTGKTMSKPNKLSRIIDEAFSTYGDLEVILLKFERPTLDTPADLRDKNSQSTVGTVMLTTEAIRNHYDNHFCVYPSPAALVVESEEERQHTIGRDDDDDDGWGDEYLEPAEDITDRVCKDPTQAELDEWKLSILALMLIRFDMLEDAQSKET